MSIAKNRLILVGLVVAIVFAAVSTCEVLAANQPEIHAHGAILMEATTGRVLFEKNAHEVMYPASMTKLLTAMIGLEYLQTYNYPAEAISVGTEIRYLPPLSSRAGASINETIRAHNLIRLLMIPSGNEIAMVIAQNVAQRHTGQRVIPYLEAEQIFADIMNERARELGAVNSNFVNPHGFYHHDHFTTPHDLALIARAALDVPLLNQIMRESTFVGNAATQNRDPIWLTRNYNVVTHNQLLIETSQFFYPYATGMKTGFHDQAGHCLAASAERDGFVMIALIFNSGPLTRFEDAVTLFEYGFNTYSFRPIQAADELLGEVAVEGVRLGYPSMLEFHTNTNHDEFLSAAEVSRIVYRIEFERSIVHRNDNGEPSYPARLTAPIYEGQIIGKVVYTLDGNFLFSDDIIAAWDVYTRDIVSDLIFYRGEVISFALSPMSIPVWIGLALIIFIVYKIAKRIEARRERSFYKLKKRYDGYKEENRLRS